MWQAMATRRSPPAGSPVALGANGNRLKMGELRVHPAIGIARVGNAGQGTPTKDEHFFLGPEIPGQGPVGSANGKGSPVTAGRFSGFKLARASIKRQGQRFRIYAYSHGAEPEEITLDTPGVAAIEWSVHLANKKAAFFRFDGQKGHHETLVYNRQKEEKRNVPKVKQGVPPNPQLPSAQTVIDPGRPQTIAGRAQGPRAINSAMGGSWPLDHRGKVAINLLGELHTDDQGRVIVLGGHGEAMRFAAAATIDDYANNDGWLDSVSDGSVEAIVTLDSGTKVQALHAWLLVGPPDFAPEIGNVVTLYDTLWATAALAKLPIPKGNVTYAREPLKRLATYIRDKAAYKPEFHSDIEPLLQRTHAQKWVFEPAFSHHGNVEEVRKEASAQKAASAPPSAQFLLGFLRPAAGNTIEQGLGSMPLLFGDVYNDRSSNRRFLALTQPQIENLQHFASGNFEKGTKVNRLTPEGLDRAALESCVGGAFFPGIDASWIIRNPHLYSEPFRLKKIGTVLNPALGLKIEPGLFSQQMALPWQADFFACKREDVTGGREPGRERWFGWWPAHRPDDVRIGGRTELWARGLKSMEDMIGGWPTRGFVVRKGADFEEVGGPGADLRTFKVRFTGVKVLNDASVFGDGRWTIVAKVNGAGVNLLTRHKAAEGKQIAIDIVIPATVGDGGQLNVVVSGIDEAGVTDDLGSAVATFKQPDYGVGPRTMTSNTSHFEVAFKVTEDP